MLPFVTDTRKECVVLSHFPAPCGSVQASELESQLAPNSYTALVSGSQMEPRKWGRGWNGGIVAAALGEQDPDSCSDWNIHGRLLRRTKINGTLTA